MQVPEDLLYTREHEWARINGKTVQVGITDYAQSALGDITFVELPKAGDKVIQFKRLATVESVKAASDVYAPLSGKVTRVNSGLSVQPELVNKSAYMEGWFVEIELNNPAEKAGLLSPSGYKTHLEGLTK